MISLASSSKNTNSEELELVEERRRVSIVVLQHITSCAELGEQRRHGEDDSSRVTHGANGNVIPERDAEGQLLDSGGERPCTR